jgi:predicted GNAT superfamily acetyltransferase
MDKNASPNDPRKLGQVEIVTAHTPADSALIADLFDKVWDVKAMVSPEIMTASVHNGGYGSVIYIRVSDIDGVDDIDGVGEHRVAVGAAFALVGKALPGCNGPNLHSHAAGVLPGFVGKGIGEMIKRHQWHWAKENGFETITWTFDPLVRRNAHFNLVKLGARVLGYHQNFYGELDDGINAGEQSDRVLVRWDVAGVDVPLGGSFINPTPNSMVIETPADIEQLRKTDRVQSDQWRARQRDAFESAQLGGLRVIGLTSDFSYVLDKRVEINGAL